MPPVPAKANPNQISQPGATSLKACRHCKEAKPVDQFYRGSYRKKSGEYSLQGECAACQNARKALWNRANAKEYNEYQRDWRGLNREHCREWSRVKYATDLPYRTKAKERSKKLYHDDPVYRERSNKRRAHAEAERMRNDPAYRKHRLAQKRVRRIVRYHSDPHYRAKVRYLSLDRFHSNQILRKLRLIKTIQTHAHKKAD